MASSNFDIVKRFLGTSVPTDEWDGFHSLRFLLVLRPALLFQSNLLCRPWSEAPELGFRRAMQKTIEQDVSVLASSKHGLVYLTPNDWTLVADKASRVNFRKGQALLQKGQKSNGVYLLVKGTARVHISTQSAAPEIGPGEICGEMSFLEDSPASASVIAHEEVEAYHLEPATLERLFELFPHLASRFYRSLATNLSRRLREIIEPKPIR
jgi:hypothetical protein